MFCPEYSPDLKLKTGSVKGLLFSKARKSQINFFFSIESKNQRVSDHQYFTKMASGFLTSLGIKAKSCLGWVCAFEKKHNPLLPLKFRKARLKFRLFLRRLILFKRRFY
jgi:hypothetical protein